MSPLNYFFFSLKILTDVITVIKLRIPSTKRLAPSNIVNTIPLSLGFTINIIPLMQASIANIKIRYHSRIPNLRASLEICILNILSVNIDKPNAIHIKLINPPGRTKMTIPSTINKIPMVNHIEKLDDINRLKNNQII